MWTSSVQPLQHFQRNTIQTLGFFLIIIFNLKATLQSLDDRSVFNADILKEVAAFYHAGCIVVAGSNTELSSHREVVELEKRVEKFIVATRVDGLHEMVDSFQCRRNRPLFVIFDSDQTQSFLQRVIQISSHPRWLLFLSGHSTVYESLERVYIPFDCEFLTVKWMDDIADMNLAYKVHKGGPLTVESFATWVPNVGLRVFSHESLYGRRADMQGLQLKALAATGGPPAVIVDRSSGRDGPVIVSGFITNVWRLLGDALNFQTEFIPCGDSAGLMINQVASKVADCVLADVTMVVPRLDDGRFLMTLITSKLRLIIRKPDEVSVEWNVLLAPFDKRLWASFSLSLLVVGLSLAYVQKKTQHCLGQNAKKTNILGDSILSVLGLFCHQGCDMSCRPKSAKTLIITVSLTSVIFMAAYSGVLISFLAHQELLVPFESLQGLENDGTFKLGTLQGAATLELFYNATSPLYRRMYESYFRPDGSAVYSGKHLPSICTESIAFLATIEYKEKNEKSINHACQLIWLDETIRPLSSSIVVAKTCTFRGALDHWLHRLRDTGIINHLRLLAWPARRTSTDAPPEFTSLTFKHVAPILLMLAVGVITAFCILLVELAVTRWHRSSRG